MNLCALRAERERLEASRDWFADPNPSTPPTPADLAAVTADNFGLDVTFKIVAVDRAIETRMRGYVRMRHDEIDDLVEDLQLIEKWLSDDVYGAVRGSIPLDSLSKAIKFTRQTRKRLLSVNAHDPNDEIDMIARKRRRDAQADREARRARPSVAASASARDFTS